MHSPDRTWWWDGDRWVAAVSPDGMWWWDGAAWVSLVPRRAPRPRWQRALGIGLACTAAVLGPIALLVPYVYFSGEAHERMWLDDEVILETAQSGCERIIRSINGADDRASRLAQGDVAINALIADMWALGAERLANDEPALRWVADWERLAVARRGFGDALANGSTDGFEVPVARDHPISDRMADVAPEECVEAVRLAANP